PPGASPAGRLAFAVGKHRFTVHDKPTEADGRAGFLDLANAGEARVTPGSTLPGAATAVAVAPDGSGLACGTNTGQIVFTDAAGRVETTASLRGEVVALCFGPDGSRVYANAGDDQRRWVFAVDARSGVVTDEKGGGGPGLLAIDPARRLLAYAGVP